MTADASVSRRRARAFGSFTRTRVERIIQLVITLGCVALGSQAFIASIEAMRADPQWQVPLVVLTFGSLTATLVACIVGRAVRPMCAMFPAVYGVVLLLWPIATRGGPTSPADQPWIFYLISVATVVTVVGCRLRVQIAVTAVIPLLYGLARLVQGGFEAAFWPPVVLDVSFALILGGILVALGWLFRAVADGVDAARARAVESYAAAAAAEATEQERVSVAALMHDSVLAALLALARSASEREQVLAVSMARDALTRLANAERDAEIGSDAPVSIPALADAVENAGIEFGAAPPTTRRIDPGAGTLPESVARALVLAATQAIANSIQHAEGRGLHLEIVGSTTSPRVVVRIVDTGPGFDADDIAEDRLGIRASIHARVTAVGGRAHVDSGPHGTRVALEWDGAARPSEGRRSR